MKTKTAKIILVCAYAIGFGVDLFTLNFQAVLLIKIIAIGMVGWAAYMLEFEKTIN